MPTENTISPETSIRPVVADPAALTRTLQTPDGDGSNADGTGIKAGADSRGADRARASARLGSKVTAEAIRRRTLFRRFRELQALHPQLTEYAARPLLGLRRTNTLLWRIAQSVSGKPEEQLTLDDFAPRARRRQTFRNVAELALESEPFRTELESLYGATMGSASAYSAAGRRTGSITTALLVLAEKEVCPPELARDLAAGKQPKALVSYLRSRYTPEVEARLRGEAHFQLYGLNSRRDLTFQLPDGTRAPLRSGSLVSFDDMSVNQPFFTPTPDGGWIVSRQGLYAFDVFSRRWLGVQLVSRPHESYTSADILRDFRKLVNDYGLFHKAQFEMSVWAARTIRGWKISPDWEIEDVEVERPGMDDEQIALVQEGLEGLGVEIIYSHDAHDKPIEGAFNHLQTVLPCYTREFVNIGRHAGEWEIAAKRLRQARGEVRTPGELGFAPMDVLVERITAAFRHINGRVPRGRSMSPDAQWFADITAHPLRTIEELRGETPDVPCAREAVFLPVVRPGPQDAARGLGPVIRGGMISLTVEGVRHDFTSAEFAALGSGYRVYLRFDPDEPTLGAAIYNRETSSANHRGYQDGEFICWAQWQMPGPIAHVETAPGHETVTTEELYGVGATNLGTTVRNAQEKFHRTAYASLPKPGRPPVSVAEARDGRGNVAVVSRGVEPSPMPARERARPSAAELVLSDRARRAKTVETVEW